MIPLKLIIEGLYSYQNRQIIDFEKLTAAGLFGIFGDVGSGKSSILEAISFVLYGETERLNARDKRSYNMMNLKSDRIYIEFDFLNYENKKYRVIREYRRNSRNFQDVKPLTVTFYEYKSSKWLPLENAAIEQLLGGLSYSNFKRTIIIPQGQFKEFLELGPTERTTMMKEIFNLHRFDLAEKTKRLFVENKSALDTLEGKLSGFEDVNAEILDEVIKRLEEEKKEKQKLQEERDKVAEEFRVLNERMNEFKNLQMNLEKLKEYEVQEEFIQQRYKELEKFENTRLQFQQLIKTEKDLGNEIKIKIQDQNQKQAEYDQLQLDLKKTSNKFEALKPRFENLESLKQKASDLETILSLKGLNTEISHLGERVVNGRQYVTLETKNYKNVENEVEEAEKKLSALQKTKIDFYVLNQLDLWYQNDKNLKNQIENKEKTILDFNQKIRLLDEELKTLKVNPKTFDKDFENQLYILENHKQKLISEENHLKLEQKLNEYAHTLHDGEPCPLCGSLEHPQVLTGEDLSHKLKDLIHKKDVVEKEIEALNSLKSKVKENQNKRSVFQDQWVKEKSECERLLSQKSDLRKTFEWPEFDPEDSDKFVELKNKSLAIEKQIEGDQASLKQLAIKLKEIKEKLDKYNEKLKALELKENQSKTEFKTREQGLKIMKFSDFVDLDNETLSLQVKDAKAEIILIENDYKSTETRLNELKIKDSGVKSSLEALLKVVSELNTKLSDIAKEIEDKLKIENFNSKDDMLTILNTNLDPVAIRKEIDEFRIGFEALKNKIIEQKEKLEDFKADDEVYKTTQQNLENLNVEFNLQADKTSKIEGELNRLKKAFDEKKELLEKQSDLLKRDENLRVMTALFKGQGFVNYISGIYLRQLCNHANVRFHRMTRNQLSLQLNENLDFEIIDYLNGGRSRSVKTLSGGQSFQVSLSLALALAESVQTQSKADKNFFFIDEGFGTQDKESVNIVFETLLQLQKENRIVGIISHVNDLKEKMPVSLHVTLHHDTGSEISLDNW